MDNNQKIDKINAYRKLLETKKFPKPAPEEESGIANVITAEFEEWVESQIASLLGETDSTKLTPEEISFLKQFVAKAQQKATGQLPPQAPPQNTPAKDANSMPRITDMTRPNANARPLKDGQRAHPAGSLLGELDRMDQRADRKDFD